MQIPQTRHPVVLLRFDQACPFSRVYATTNIQTFWHTWFGRVENFSFAHGIDHQRKRGENLFHTGVFGRHRGQRQQQVDHLRRRRQFVRRRAAWQCREGKQIKGGPGIRHWWQGPCPFIVTLHLPTLSSVKDHEHKSRRHTDGLRVKRRDSNDEIGLDC